METTLANRRIARLVVETEWDGPAHRLLVSYGYEPEALEDVGQTLNIAYTRPSSPRGFALGLPDTRSRAPLARRASASAKATARPRRSAYGAKAGRLRGSLATLVRTVTRWPAD